ncbi:MULTISPECIES: permease [unclassified Clostridium]|uniref:permease n=1 Tax=Clostridium TaxID=1485 RepID=UPI0021AB2898|nr:MULTISPECIES: permease [unclassified Clostridium]MDU2291120.1 permease [Clostridium celatum]
MNIVIKIFKRYKNFFLSLLVLIILSFFSKSILTQTINTSTSSILQMLSVLPPVMILLGLMDVWIPREQLIKYMGNKSGIIGIILSILIGSIAAGPMYASFPFTAVLIKKGAKFSNIIIFMNAWCLTKVSTLLFEFSALGYKFTLARLLIDIPGVLIMSYFINLLMPKDSLDELYNKYN